MTETIILAPYANGTELIRSLAEYGVPSMGLRITGAAELARLALLRSGKVIDGSVLSRSQEAAVIDSFLREIPYFSSSSYADSEKIASSLSELRALITDDEERTLTEKLPQGEFSDKNNAILAVYRRFLDELSRTGSIDSITLIRRAIAEAAPLPGRIMTLREYPLSPLERLLAERLSGCSVEETSLPVLFGASGIAGSAGLAKCYGSSNEVEYILDTIFSGSIPLDRCTVAVSDVFSYSQLFYDYSRSAGFEITFGCGVPILNANPARLLKLWMQWDTDGYHTADYLHSLVFSEAFSRTELYRRLGRDGMTRRELEALTETAGRLRLGRNASENKKRIDSAEASLRSEASDDPDAFLSALRALGDALAMTPSAFLGAFSVIRRDHPGRLDRSALNVITEALDAFFMYHPDGDSEEILPELLNKSVCSENRREGALHVTGIQGALACIRPNLFIAGLSADQFPGSPRENYLLLDSDLLLFSGEPYARTSSERVRSNIRTYGDLRALASSLGSSVRLSYSDFDLAGLKERNLSSVITEPVTDEAGFFTSGLSGTRFLGRAFIDGKRISFREPSPEDISAACSLDKAYSPSALSTFFECPRHFMLARVLGLEEDEPTDPFEIISAAEAGTLLHSLMEKLANSAMSRDEFRQLAGSSFDAFMKLRVPPAEASAETEKAVFLQLADNAWEQDKGNEVLSAEEEVSVAHETGIKLHGYPDRVERLPDGRCIIVDYKTGRTVKHYPNDIDSCLQAVIYAYLVERNGTVISGCEFRYPRLKKTVPCRYDDDMKRRLAEKLSEFRDAMLSADFPAAVSDDACRFCRFKAMCGKEARK